MVGGRAGVSRWHVRGQLAAAGLVVVGVAPAGDEDSERRLRQLGLDHVGADADPPATLVDLTRAALAADPAPTPPAADPPPPADGETPHTLVAVWGPKGATGRTTVAVNLAFEAAPLVGEVLLVDADTYGGAVAHANMQQRHRYPQRQQGAQLERQSHPAHAT
jgi:Mrp family chromosome partitioning ATPase